MGLVASALVPALGLAPVAWAASCNGASHQTSLTAPDATPRFGTPTTTIQFRVEYHDSAECPPSSVLVRIAGFGQLAMTAAGGSFGTSMLYVASTQLPIGRWSYSFQATGGTGGGEQTVGIAGPGRTRIRAAPPAPTPTPTPTPKPTATPKPTPTPTPDPTA